MTIKNDIESLTCAIKGLQSMQLIHHADRATLLALVEAICLKIGISEIDGKTPTEWWNQRRETMLDEKLIECEDTDPEMAAVFQQRIDRAKDNLNKKNS